MKQQLVTYFTLLFSITLWAQNKGLTDFKQKYEPYYKVSNISMEVLLKNEDSFSSQRLNFETDNQNNVFNIGSATKTFTAVLILQEVDRNKLRLSDSIGMYLSPIQNVSSSLTIEQLLRHQSGLAEVVGNQKWNAYNIPHDSLLRRDVLRNVPPPTPRKVGAFDYTNTNYILLGLILEKINDKSYFELLQERIFTPCKMLHSYPYVSKNIDHLVHPTDEKHERDQYNGINYKFFADYAFSAGCIASKLTDMALFYEALFESETLISTTSRDKMTDFQDGNYGLGLQKLVLNGTVYYGHGGNNYGYAFRNYYNPQNGDMILYYINRFRVPMKNAVIEDLQKVLYHQNIPLFRTGTVREFNALKGTYILEEIGLKFTIYEREKLLYLTINGLKVPLVSTSPEVLSDLSSGIDFTLNPKHSHQIIWTQNGKQLIATRQQ